MRTAPGLVKLRTGLRLLRDALRALGPREGAVPTLLARASIPKIDVEGAEAVIFSGPCEWIGRVDGLIELHEDSHFGDAREAFFPPVEGRRFTLGTSGELTVALRPAGSA